MLSTRHSFTYDESAGLKVLRRNTVFIYFRQLTSRNMRKIIRDIMIKQSNLQEDITILSVCTRVSELIR